MFDTMGLDLTIELAAGYGRRVLFHHSNYDGPQLDHFGLQPHARQRMTQKRFHDLARAAGLRVIASHVIPWAGIPALDCVSMVELPA